MYLFPQSTMTLNMDSPLSLVSCVIYTSQDRAQTTRLFSVMFPGVLCCSSGAIVSLEIRFDLTALSADKYLARVTFMPSLLNSGVAGVHGPPTPSLYAAYSFPSVPHFRSNGP